MKGLRLAFLLALVFGALVWAWLDRTEPSRRYARLHELVERNWTRTGSAWPAADALDLWSDLDFFSRKAPRDFDARLMASAPELFAALARLVNAHFLPSCVGPQGVLIDVPSALESAVATLNKAAGIDVPIAA